MSPLTNDVAIEAARSALLNEGLPSTNLRLERIGTNAVYLTDQHVLRVAEQSYDRELLQQQASLIRWLLDRQFPTAALIASSEVAGFPVTVWDRIISQRAPEAADLAGLASSFHQLTNAYDGSLPQWEPLGRLGRRLDKAEPDQECLSSSELDSIKDIKDQLITQAQGLSFALEAGPIHGDMHVGNLVANEAGVYLIDFDRIAFGPREWDLVEPLAGIHLFGGEPADWSSFVSGYGYDVADWEGCDVLLRLRGLFMFSWLLTLERSPEVRDEIARRKRFFLEKDGWPSWRAV